MRFKSVTPLLTKRDERSFTANPSLRKREPIRCMRDISISTNVVTNDSNSVSFLPTKQSSKALAKCDIQRRGKEVATAYQNTAGAVNKNCRKESSNCVYDSSR